MSEHTPYYLHLDNGDEELAMYVLKSNKQTIELSKEIGISFSTLSSLRTGRSWKHLHERINNER